MYNVVVDAGKFKIVFLFFVEYFSIFILLFLRNENGRRNSNIEKKSYRVEIQPISEIYSIAYRRKS